MKAIKYILLAGFLLTSLAACENKNREKTQDEIEAAWPNTITTMEMGDFVLVKRDTTGFTRGNNSIATSSPEHIVKFSKSYYMCTKEVTQAQWKAIMGTNPSDNEGIVIDGANIDNYPVNNITIADANKFIETLNAKTGRKFAIPTEAQWEWAAMGGLSSQGYSYSGSNTLSEVAWYSGNSDDYLNEVGKLKANELGLHDMTGNIEEWTADKYMNYNSSEVTDPTGAKSGAFYACRGGNFEESDTEFLNIKSRKKVSGTNANYTIGLRLILEEPLSTELIAQ